MINVLIVGCGLKAKSNTSEFTYVNLDQMPLPGVDLVMDLNQLHKLDSSAFTSWSGAYNPNYQVKWRGLIPFVDGYFDQVIAEDVLEHVDNPITVVQELGRVLKVGGTLWIRGPDETMVWHDLTHKRAFTERTFDGFCKGTYDRVHYGHYYGKIEFEMVEKKVVNHGWEYTMRKLG